MCRLLFNPWSLYGGRHTKQILQSEYHGGSNSRYIYIALMPMSVGRPVTALLSSLEFP